MKQKSQKSKAASSGNLNSKKESSRKLLQLLYLTVNSFNKNSLFESAASCAFGFIFSFIPILMIIISVLSGIVKISPVFREWLDMFANSIRSFYDIEPIIENVSSRDSVHVLDIFLGFWVLWIARKLFSSMVNAMSNITRKEAKRKSFMNQLVTFLTEFIVVVVIIVVIIASFLVNKFFELPVFSFIRNTAPFLFSKKSNFLVSVVMYLIVFIFTVTTYRVMTGTKPKIRLCIFYGLLSTVTFLVVTFFINLFLNSENYNIIYGTISTLVILMMKVYMFFMIYMFFAQMLYVSQYFDELILGELYLLPGYDNTTISGTIRRSLFINPYVVENLTLVKFPKGSVIYKEGDDSLDVFYIKSGTVSEISKKDIIYHDKGNFFGEIQCILKSKRISCVTAITDCEIIKIKNDEFAELLQKNSSATKKALNQITKSNFSF